MKLSIVADYFLFFARKITREELNYRRIQKQSIKRWLKDYENQK